MVKFKDEPDSEMTQIKGKLSDIEEKLEGIIGLLNAIRETQVKEKT